MATLNIPRGQERQGKFKIIAPPTFKVGVDRRSEDAEY